MWLYSWCSDIFLHHRPSARAAMVLSKHTFYYHITSNGCRDLDRDLDSGWIICLYTGISQGAVGWLNTALELKCRRQSFQKRNLEKKIHLAHYFDAFTGSAFYSIISLHSSVSPFLFFKPREHLKDDMSIKSKTISPNVSLVKLGF